MSERADFVRDSMRQSWGSMIDRYTRVSAGNTEQLAATLLDLVGLRAGERVLDVATGTGVVAVMAAQAVGAGGEVVAADLAAEWRDVVATRAAAAGVTNVRFQAASADALDQRDDSFDVALCQLGLMFVPEPAQALREMRRVLRAGGRLGVVVWSTGDRVRLFTATGPLLQPYLPKPEPGKELPTPLQLGEPGLIERLIGEAGFRDLATQRRTFDWVADEPEQHWQSNVAGPQAPEPARSAIAALPEAEREELHKRYVAALEAYRKDGAIKLPSEAIFVTGAK